MGTNITTPDKRWRLTAPGSAGWAVVLFIVGACLLRFVYLTADPHYYGWFGHIIDEGRWTMNARSLILHDQLVPDGRTAHLVAAPLFQLVSYIAFLLLGVSHFAARLFPAICGAVFLIVLTATLWRRTTMPALFLGLSVVAFQADYVVLSRVATPEIVLILFELLIFLAMIFGPRRPSHLFWAGFLTTIAIGFKATSISLVFVFSVAAFFYRDPRAHGIGLRGRLTDALLYLGGLLVTALLLLSVTTPLWIGKMAAYWGDIHYAFTNMVRFNSFYGMLRVPFLDYMSPIFNIGALGVWLVIMASLAGLHRDTPATQRRMLRIAAGWAAAYAVVMVASNYTPGRYYIHVLTPVAIIVALGTGPFATYGVQGVTANLTRGSRLHTVFNLGVLALPATVMAGPLIVDLLGMLDIAAERFRFTLLSLTLPWLLFTGLAYGVRNRPRALGYLVLVPVVGAIGWFGFWTVATDSPIFWPVSNWASHFAMYTVFVLLFCFVAVLIAAFATLPKLGGSWALVVTGAVVSGAWLVQLAPGFISPTYTVRDASRELGRLFPPESIVVQNSAEGLFLDNDLRFHRSHGSLEKDALPERLVFAFRRPDTSLLDKYYDRVEARTLHISRQYRENYTTIDSLLCFQGDCPNLFIYRLKDSPNNGSSAH